MENKVDDSSEIEARVMKKREEKLRKKIFHCNFSNECREGVCQLIKEDPNITNCSNNPNQTYLSSLETSKKEWRD